MDASWLKRRLAVAEAEAAHMVDDERLGPDPVPFGFNNLSWQKLLAEMQRGNEL